jgi:hypothetical protein
MSLSSIARAASDPQLIDRVTASAHQVAMTDSDKANTVLGQSLLTGQSISNQAALVLMYPVAIDTEQAYESALLSQRGAPGFDKDIITDAQISTSIKAHWPMTRPPAIPATP